MISKLEPSAPKEILVNAKMRTHVYIFSGGTWAGFTPEKLLSRNKRNMKSPAISPPRKDLIPNQDINRLITKQGPSIPPIKAKYPPVFKPLFNDAYDHNST